MNTLRLVLCLALCGASLRSAEYQLPTDIRPPAGLWAGSGGTEPDTTGWTVLNVVTTFGVNNTGSANTSSEMANALDYCIANPQTVLFCPAGTYRFDTPINNPTSAGRTTPQWVLRGENDANGNSLTVFDYRGSSQIAWSLGGSETFPSSAIAITGGLTKGSTTITVSDRTVFTQYKMARIQLVNDPNRVWSTKPDVNPIESFNVMVLDITPGSGTTGTLTFEPPIAYEYSSTSTTGATAKAGSVLITYGVMVENIVIDGTNSGSSMQKGLVIGAGFYGCVFKNIRVRDYQNYGFWINGAIKTSLSECWIEQSPVGTNRAGLLIDGGATGSRIENCIFEDSSPPIEAKDGAVGTVYGYNFFKISRTAKAINTNHGPQNMLQLVEGNVIYGTSQSDGYFGGETGITFYRNWLGGIYYNTDLSANRPAHCISFNRMTRQANVIGNILQSPDFDYTTVGTGVVNGNPNLGNSDYTGTAEPSIGSWWADSNNGVTRKWNSTLTTRTSDTVGQFTVYPSGDSASLIAAISTSPGKYAGADAMVSVVAHVGGDVFSVTRIDGGAILPPLDDYLFVAPGGNSFQELDLDVANTLTRKANFNYADNAIPAGESIGTDTLADSWYLSSAPSRFTDGGLAWPPFNPYNSPSTVPSPQQIPAGYRYFNNAWPTTSGTSTANVVNLNVGTIRLAP